MTFVRPILALFALVVVAWAAITAWPAIIHGYPLYAVLLALTAVVALIVLIRSLRPRSSKAYPGQQPEPATSGRQITPRSRRWPLWVSIPAAVLAVGWIAAMAWLRPFSAVEPALAAMVSDSRVSVTESATQIIMSPTGAVSDTGVFFQPGAKVEARAYAAVLRPLAEAGHLVVIPKQPLGIAFLALGAFESAQSAHPEVAEWIVAGHSLGGTVATMEAVAHDDDAQGPARGLLLYASYPAGDVSQDLTSSVLSISATNDMLATPADIADSKANLPKDAQFIVIDGAVHSFFGDYGPQPGDGTPTISHDDARAQISSASVAFAAKLGASVATS